MKNKIYTIDGTVKDDRKDGSNSLWILNGDIEINAEGKEVYIVNTIKGEQNRFVEDMPLEVQKYIKENKKIKIIDNNCIKKLQTLAEKISKAGSIIAKDNISKDYIIGNGIIVTSDSGYEAIYIGDIEGNNGYMCLYTNNTSKRNSFPKKNVISELLEKVLKGEKLETGEGKAAYYDWEEFGGMKKQLKYFSQIVKQLAGINE